MGFIDEIKARAKSLQKDKSFSLRQRTKELIKQQRQY
mgnify:CR=1 FL=1